VLNFPTVGLAKLEISCERSSPCPICCRQTVSFGPTLGSKPPHAAHAVAESHADEPLSVVRSFGLFRARGLLLPAARALPQTGLTHTGSLLPEPRSCHAQLIDLLRQLRLFARVNLSAVLRLN